jgi:hypothetical protein
LEAYPSPIGAGVSSEYSNKIWKALSDAFGIIDPKSISKRISTDPIIPTVSMDVMPYTIVQCAGQDFPAGPTATIQFCIVGQNNTPIPATLPRMVTDNSQLETLIIGWLIEIQIAAVGDPVNLNSVTVDHLLSTPLGGGGSIHQSLLRQIGYFDFAAGITRQQFTMGPNQTIGNATKHIISQGKPIWVPAGCSYAIQVYTDPTVLNFLATGQITAHAWGITVPKGVKPPLL